MTPGQALRRTAQLSTHTDPHPDLAPAQNRSGSPQEPNRHEYCIHPRTTRCQPPTRERHVQCDENVMIVSIVGGHGSIARLITRLLTARGHTVHGLVRDEDQFGDLRADGAEPVLCDLESIGDDALDTALDSSEVVVFAAGAGPDSGPERKKALDRDGAIMSVRSAARVGADRFLIISSMGADDPPQDDEDFSVYLRAKAAADDAARAADIDATIVRPGALTDDEPSGSVDIADSTGRGEIPRGDVAHVLVELIDTDRGRNATFELISGDTSIQDAVSVLA